MWSEYLVDLVFLMTDVACNDGYWIPVKIAYGRQEKETGLFLLFWVIDVMCSN